MERRRGFTLIELLVVIAIIGILAAMLFPVFARARESARKIQCLSNVKNIAIAFQMYLTDYDSLYPTEHRAEVEDYYAQFGCDPGATYITYANPYLRAPVLLDEYIKNRDVWRCPSSSWQSQVPINPCYNGDWLGYLKAHDCAGSPCQYPFPAGWGGDITDSVMQGSCGTVLQQSIGTNWNLRDLKTGQINDAAKYVVCGDVGAANFEFTKTERCSYVDTNMWARAACEYPVADWVNCSWTTECGAGDPRFQLDPQFRKEHGKARHLGGVNIGFADGHAKWMHAEVVAFAGEQWTDPSYAKATNELEGVGVCGFGPPNAAAQAFLDSLK